jgi:hypothetical protein
MEMGGKCGEGEEKVNVLSGAGPSLLESFRAPKITTTLGALTVCHSLAVLRDVVTNVNIV